MSASAPGDQGNCLLAADQQAAPSAAVLNKLAAKDQARKAAAEKRREETREAQDPREDTRAFLQLFTTQMQAVQAELQTLLATGPSSATETSVPAITSSTSGQLADGAAGSQAVQTTLDRLLASALQLEKSVSDASYFLPAYDQKQCMLSLSDFKSRVETARGTLVPKKKFAFSRKVNRVKGPAATVEQAPAEASGDATGSAGATSSTQAGDHTTAQQPHRHSLSSAGPLELAPRDVQLAQSGCGLMGLRDQVVVRHAHELNSNDFVLLDLEGCTVYLLGHMPALRMIGLKNTTVVTGPVTGACFVDRADGCTFVLATYQARIHRAERTDFYLRVRSKPIIEHSNKLRFAPYSLQDPGVQALLQQHMLGEETELYCQVDDFGWIKATQSPNWAVLPETERTGPTEVPAALQQQQ